MIGILEVMDSAESPWAIRWIASHTVTTTFYTDNAERQLLRYGWTIRGGDWIPPTDKRLAYQAACKAVLGQDLSMVDMCASGLGLHYACQMEVARIDQRPGEGLAYAVQRLREGKSIVP